MYENNYRPTQSISCPNSSIPAKLTGGENRGEDRQQNSQPGQQSRAAHFHGPGHGRQMTQPRHPALSQPGSDAPQSRVWQASHASCRWQVTRHGVGAQGCRPSLGRHIALTGSGHGSAVTMVGIKWRARAFCQQFLRYIVLPIANVYNNLQDCNTEPCR